MIFSHSVRNLSPHLQPLLTFALNLVLSSTHVPGLVSSAVLPPPAWPPTCHSVIFQNANMSMSPKTLGWLLPALQIKSKFVQPGTQALHHLLQPHLPLLPSGTQSASSHQGLMVPGKHTLAIYMFAWKPPHAISRLLLSEAYHEAPGWASLSVQTSAVALITLYSQ